MTLFGSTMKGSWIHETLKMLDETRLASPRHDLWREENFSVELEISPNNEQREKSQKYFRFHFRVQKIFKRHLRFVGLSPSLSPSGATTSLASKTWKQDVLRETGKQNKQTRIQRWKSRNASFVPSLLPLFPHGFWHTGNRAGVRPLFFFPFYALSTGSSESFSFSTSRSEFSSPATFVKRWSVKRGWRTEEEEEDVNVHFYSRLLISVGETGRPSRRSKKKWRR